MYYVCDGCRRHCLSLSHAACCRRCLSLLPAARCCPVSLFPAACCAALRCQVEFHSGEGGEKVDTRVLQLEGWDQEAAVTRCVSEGPLGGDWEVAWGHWEGYD